MLYSQTRQNLSEVENLYFFHHHGHGQRTPPSSFSRHPTFSSSNVLSQDYGAPRNAQIEAQTPNLSIPRTIYTDVVQNSEPQSTLDFTELRRLTHTLLEYNNNAMIQSSSTDKLLRLDSFATNVAFESRIAPMGESFSSLHITSPSLIPMNKVQEEWRHNNRDIRQSCDRSCCTTPTPTGSSSASSLKGSSPSLPIADRPSLLVVPAQPEIRLSPNASSFAALNINVNQSWTYDSFWSTLPRFAGHVISNDPALPYSRTAQ